MTADNPAPRFRRNRRVRAPFVVEMAEGRFDIHDFSLRGVALKDPRGASRFVPGTLHPATILIPLEAGDAHIAVELEVVHQRPDDGIVGFGFGDPSRELLESLTRFIEETA